jgi:hypothetical protein
MAGLPDMQELSPLRAETAKQIAATLRSCVVAEGRKSLNCFHRPAHGQKPPLVLGFDAWHFQLSDGPILEEMTYA